jgi:hypothetical protein
VLLAVFPLTVVLATIRPSENTMTLLLIVEVVSLVTTSIMPCEYTCPVHLVIVPLSGILAAIRPSVDAPSLNIVIEEGTFVGWTISPEELALAVLLAFLIIAFVAGTIRPDLLTLAMLLIFEPPTLITGTIRVVIDTEAVSLVIFPLPVVYVTVSMDKATFSISFIVTPVSLIERAVNPDLHTLTVLVALSVPLTSILGSIVEDNRWFRCLFFGVGNFVIIDKIFKRRSDFLNETARFIHLFVSLDITALYWLTTHSVSLETVLTLDVPTSDLPTVISLNCDDSPLLGSSCLAESWRFGKIRSEFRTGTSVVLSATTLSHNLLINHI